MLYEYECKFCGTHDIVKPVSRFMIDEQCPNCRSVMTRRFAFRGYTQVDNFIPGFNYTFGKTFTNAQQQKEEIRRLAGEEGREVVEVGNDTSVPKPPHKEVDTKEAVRELRYLWQK